MSLIQREAFVISSLMADRVKRLNRAVQDRELLFVLAPSGSGKDRFFDWWWQEGCMQSSLTRNGVLDPNEIILVSLRPPPSGSVPPTCVTFSKIWHGLQELDRAIVANQRVQPTGKARSWYTEQQSLSLIYDNVFPLADKLSPRAFVLLNGECLDKRALQYLIELRSPIHRGKPHIARCAMIICAAIEPDNADDHKFAKLVNEVNELRVYWPRRLEIGLMEAREFQEVLFILIRHNLHAIFTDDMNRDVLVQEAAEWTQAEWRLITDQLIPLLDEELGPKKIDGPRLLSSKVWEQVRSRWKARQW